MLLDELAAALVGAGVGVLNTNILLTANAPIPTGDGPYLTMIETGGFEAERTHNSVSVPAYVNPTVQITVRGKFPSLNRAMAQDAYDYFTSVRNTTLSGVWYREIVPMQEVFDGGPDATGRPTTKFNIRMTKRPS